MTDRQTITVDGVELDVPTMSQVEQWMSEGGCEAVCPEGCWVEPDGHCEHGHESWLLYFGLI